MPMKNISLKKRAKSAQQGIVLLEALIAVLLFSMGVLALVGLQAAMMKNTEDSKLRSEASFIAQQWLGLMWADPDSANLFNYAIPDNTDTRFNIANLLPNGTRTVAVSGVIGTNTPIVVTVTINWQQPGKSVHQYTTIANIAGG
jgi:type IV pilus assembly protein PilV